MQLSFHHILLSVASKLLNRGRRGGYLPTALCTKRLYRLDPNRQRCTLHRWAFSIWGLIFLGELIFVIWGALPANRDERVLKEGVGCWFAIACVVQVHVYCNAQNAASELRASNLISPCCSSLPHVLWYCSWSTQAHATCSCFVRNACRAGSVLRLEKRMAVAVHPCPFQLTPFVSSRVVVGETRAVGMH